MKPSEALALHKDAILAVLAKYPVKNPMLFGSVARGEDIEGSDLDIVADVAGTLSYFDLTRIEIELSEAAGVKVDFGLRKDIKPDILAPIIAEMRPL